MAAGPTPLGVGDAHPHRRAAPPWSMRMSGPPVRPTIRAGTPAAAARSSTAGTNPSATDTTIREALSPKSAAAAAKWRRHHGSRRLDGGLDADPAAVERALRQRDGHAALGAVVRRLHQPVPAPGRRPAAAAPARDRGRAPGAHRPPCRAAAPGTPIRRALRDCRPARSRRRRSSGSARVTVLAASSRRPTTPSTGVG